VRHRADHLPAALVKAKDASEVARADTLLAVVRSGEGRADRLYAAAEAILSRALEVKDLRTALGAIAAAARVMAEGRQYLELRGEMTGELTPPSPTMSGVFNVMVLPKTCDLHPVEPPKVIERGKGIAAGLTLNPSASN
jgi:hypothetical protein